MEKLLDKLFFLTEELDAILQGGNASEVDKANKMNVEQNMVIDEIINKIEEICETENVEKITETQEILMKYIMRIDTDYKNEFILFKSIFRFLSVAHRDIFLLLIQLKAQQNEK